MRILLTNFGTTGDFQPFLALAMALRPRGHEPILAFAPHFETRARAAGFPFVPIGPDLRQAQQEINLSWMNEPESVDQMKAILQPVVSALPQAFAELRAACDDADMLISGPAQPAARMIHELSGIPFVSVQLSHFGGIGTPALQQASTALINPFRAELALPPLENPLTIDANSPQLALYAISRHILARSQEWPPHYHITGYFFLNDGKEQTIDPGLAGFVAAASPPVVISFGSMSHNDPAQLFHLLLRAVDIAGCRAVIQQSPEEIITADRPNHVYVTGYVPHDWLFPKAACIVHHGGGGTAGAVFRSGVPSIFVPHGQIFDQYYLAILAEEKGCAGETIPYAELTAERLGVAIAQVVKTARYRSAAAALGQKIAQEQGVPKACELIETLGQQLGLHASTKQKLPGLNRQERLGQRHAYLQRQQARKS